MKKLRRLRVGKENYDAIMLMVSLLLIYTVYVCPKDRNGLGPAMHAAASTAQALSPENNLPLMHVMLLVTWTAQSLESGAHRHSNDIVVTRSLRHTHPLPLHGPPPPSQPSLTLRSSRALTLSP
jgi:hypothetical protein